MTTQTSSDTMSQSVKCIDNDTAMAQGTRFYGQVKFFDRERGFGFVTRLEDKVDYFVHFNDIKPTQKCWNVLFEGEYVEFGVRTGPNGFQTGEVTGINGGSLLCEHAFQPNNRVKKSGNKKSHDNDVAMES